MLLLFCLTTIAWGQRLTLTPSLTLAERYDDNIFQSRTDKTDDFVTTISPSIRLQYLSTEPTPDTRLELNYRMAFEAFADHSSQNQLAHYFSSSLTSQLAPSLSVQLRELLIVTEEPFERDERLSDPTGLRPASQQQRARTIRNEIQSGLDVRLSGRITLGVRFGSLIEDVSIPQELDEFRYTVGTDLGYVVNVARASRLLATYQIAFHTFRDNGIILLDNSSAAFNVHTFSAGIQHELTPTLAVNAALGYNFTTSDVTLNDGHEAIFADVKLTKTFHTGTASLGYLRHFFSGQGNGRVILADTVRAAVAVNLTGKLTARLDSNISWADFQGPTIIDRNQYFGSIRPSVTYYILRPWNVSVGYAYEHTHYTDKATGDITDHRLLLGTQFALRDWLLLGLSYRYASRSIDGNATVNEVTNFARNQFSLTVTAAPNLRF
ncbi:MAG: hypothetical protein AB7N91_16600 [Candidatus Tectimicrobiota bacterium]